jgi:hypothetical protein
MKITIIKWLIKWLFKNHKYLMEETVIGIGYHRHKDPRRADNLWTPGGER